MKTLKLTLAAVVLSAFTMTAQQDAKAATTKTEVSKEVKEEVRAPHKMQEQKRAANKVVNKTTATGQDSDVAKQVAPGTPTKKVTKKAKKAKAKGELSQDEKAVQKAGIKNDD